MLWAEHFVYHEQGELTLRFDETGTLAGRALHGPAVDQILAEEDAKMTRHSKYVTFQLAAVAVPRRLFAAILDRIARLAPPPPPLVE